MVGGCRRLQVGCITGVPQLTQSIQLFPEPFTVRDLWSPVSYYTVQEDRGILRWGSCSDKISLKSSHLAINTICGVDIRGRFAAWYSGTVALADCLHPAKHNAEDPPRTLFAG